MTTIDSKKEVIRLVAFGEAKGLLEPEDRHYAVNALLETLRLDEPWDGTLTAEETDELARLQSPAPILELLLSDAASRGVLPDGSVTQRDLLDARLMDCLLPRPSDTIRKFRDTAERESIQAATDQFYRMAIYSNYIRMDRIRSNAYWTTPTPYGDLEITINLSKPEKDPKTIAAERNMPQGRYPKCLLCPENVGYTGRLNHPARQNLRVLPLALGGETWYFQYSPYVYYNEHCILLNGRHVPMKLGRETFVKLFDVLEALPHYFVGSNADLPIVGGSILSHDHFQGGRHTFAMEKAEMEAVFAHFDYPGVEVGIVRWPLSVLRLTGMSREELTAAADQLLTEWRSYTDESADILACTKNAEEDVLHNTITPIARKLTDGRLQLDLVLRNNRTTAEHPDGLFHPHAGLHHIKKENIGLIEVMGLAVLPGRLQDELEAIADSLASEDESWRETGHPLEAHAPWIAELIGRHGRKLTRAQMMQTLQEEVGIKYMQVLLDAGVFKRDEAGQDAFRRFLSHAGYRLELSDR